MRIALVTDTFTPEINGVTTVLRRMVQALEAAGWSVAVVAPRYPDGPESGAERLRIRSVAFPPYPAIRLSIPLGREVADFLRDFAPDVVHVATEGPLGFAGRRFALRGKVPLVTSYHTDFPGYARHYGAAALEPAVWRWLQWFHRPATLIHTPGTAVRDELHARGLTQAVVWGRGVDTHHFHPGRDPHRWRRRLRMPDDGALVLHVGRLAPEKNIGTLTEAWRLARAALGGRAVFAIAGEGPMEDYIQARAPWARRIGFIDREALADLYVAGDLCVLPSATETCGLVALEAMASGRPVVAADAGGLRESVRHGENGFLAPPHDARAFAAHIVHLVMERDRRIALGRAARDTALGRDVTGENAELLGQYRTVAGAAEPARPGCAA